MGGSGSGGSSSKTTSKPPEWFTKAATTALAQGEKVAHIPYIPYMGPDVAAFNPQQIDAMQQSADWSSAFNTPGQAAPRVSDSLMPATDFGGGLKGYSSYGGYQQAIDQLGQQYPGLANYLKTFFIDPVTGKYPGGSTTPTPGTGGGPGTGPRGGGLGGGNLGFSNQTPQWIIDFRNRTAGNQGGGGGSGGGANWGGGPIRMGGQGSLFGGSQSALGY